MSDTPYIFDVTGANFEQLVIENSFHKPVLVDFWADWCAPCKALMPLLAQIAESYQGELLLAKVNCDVEQDIVMRFGIRSLPTVVLFKDGQPVDGFAGAQPESQIRALLEPHVKAPALPDEDPLEVAQALFAEGRIGDAEATLKALLAENNENAAALILYARCLAERGELEEAQAILDAVKSDEHKQALAGARAQL
ncbi:thioredoxin, partial [Pseudomonas aeruginosa]|nr:thioredoxin [Pseudomonas aeruginosa]MBF3262658.1 thioredoxin [Pseudomonas aeruginosa]